MSETRYSCFPLPSCASPRFAKPILLRGALRSSAPSLVRISFALRSESIGSSFPILSDGSLFAVTLQISTREGSLFLFSLKFILKEDGVADLVLEGDGDGSVSDFGAGNF